MSHPVPATLYRIAAVAGCGSAVVLARQRRQACGAHPDHCRDPAGRASRQILALALVTALYLRLRSPYRCLRPVAYLLNGFALAALVGVEFVINLVFRDLSAETVMALRAGALGLALTAASILFLLGTLAFVTAMLRTREVPPVPLMMYAVGAVPVALRAFVPEVVLDVGLAVLAVGLAWLAVWLFGRSARITTWTLTSTPPAGHYVTV